MIVKQKNDEEISKSNSFETTRYQYIRIGLITERKTSLNDVIILIKRGGEISVKSLDNKLINR